MISYTFRMTTIAQISIVDNMYTDTKNYYRLCFYYKSTIYNNF